MGIRKEMIDSVNPDTVEIDDSGYLTLEGTNLGEILVSADLSFYLARDTGVNLDGTGGIVDISAGTTFDVSATTGGIRRSTGFTRIQFAGQTGITPIASSGSIWVYIDTAGTVQQQTTLPTQAENRQRMYITRLAMVSGSIFGQESYLNPLSNTINSLRDYLSYVASPKKGLALSANGANLSVDVSAGSLFELGINPAVPDDPNTLPFDAQAAPTILRGVQEGPSIGASTTINVTEYNPTGTTLTTMTNNRWKILTFFKFGSGTVGYQEGQSQFTTADAAQAAISTRTFNLNPIFANGTRMGWLIVLKDATDLSNPAQARFINDEGSFSSTVGTTGALLAANNLSDLLDSAAALTNLGVTATAAELNTLDGITATVTELNYTDGVTSPIQNQLNTKLPEVLTSSPATDHSANGPQTNTVNAGVTVLAGEVLYLATDGEWALADASVSSTSEKLIAIALEAGTDGNPLLVALPGSFVRDDSWSWTAGDTLYLSLTAGDLSSTVAAGATDEVSRIIGYAVSPTVIYLQPQQGVVHV